MSNIETALQDFVEELKTSHDELGLRNAGNRFAVRLGYRWFAYILFSAPTDRIITSYPKSWARRYVEQHYDKIDPVVGLARRSLQAFEWNDRRLPRLSRAQHRFLKDAETFGIFHGTTFPICGGFGQHATFTLAGDDGTEGVSSFPANRRVEMLELAGLYFHTHVKTTLDLNRPHDPATKLTTRQAQCLQWAAQGKKAGETASILNVSTRAVTFHLENARHKMGAATVTQAVVQALLRGQISG